jgi:hypothetical protein
MAMTLKRTILLLAALLTAGCGQAGQVLPAQADLPKEEASPAFLDRVASMPTVTENDALRGLLMLLDGKDPSEGFAQRVEALKARRIVDPQWDFVADRPITKGRLAYMLYQACKVPGGLTLTLTGPSERYCLKELQFIGMMSSGVTYAEVTGLEFVAAVTRADTYVQTGELPDIMASSSQQP